MDIKVSGLSSPNPVIFLENEMIYGHSFDVPDDVDYLVPLGKACVVRMGTDVTVTAFSLTVGMALEAAEILEKQNISVEVIDLRTLRPLDTQTILTSLKKTNRIVSVEEGWPFAGIGAEISALVCDYGFDDLDAPPVRICGVDVPLPYAANLEELALPSVDKIVQGIKNLFHR